MTSWSTARGFQEPSGRDSCLCHRAAHVEVLYVGAEAVKPQATCSLWPAMTKGTPGSVTPAAWYPGARRSAENQRSGSARARAYHWRAGLAACGVGSGDHPIIRAGRAVGAGGQTKQGSQGQEVACVFMGGRRISLGAEAPLAWELSCGSLRFATIRWADDRAGANW